MIINDYVLYAFGLYSFNSHEFNQSSMPNISASTVISMLSPYCSGINSAATLFPGMAISGTHAVGLSTDLEHAAFKTTGLQVLDEGIKLNRPL